MSGQTPTPWRVDINFGNHVVAEKGGLIATCDDGNYFTNPGDGPRNAAFIVEACNQHAHLVAQNERLREAVAEAIEVIKEWHNMGDTSAEDVWPIYLANAPEMKRLTAALALSQPEKQS